MWRQTSLKSTNKTQYYQPTTDQKRTSKALQNKMSQILLQLQGRLRAPYTLPSLFHGLTDLTWRNSMMFVEKKADDRLDMFFSELRSLYQDITVLRVDMESMNQTLRQTMLHRLGNPPPPSRLAVAVDDFKDVELERDVTDAEYLAV